MCFFISLFPATFWAILGYLVLFSSTRATGSIRTFGRFLGIWALIISGCILLAGIYVSTTDLCSMDMMSRCWAQ